MYTDCLLNRAFAKLESCDLKQISKATLRGRGKKKNEGKAPAATWPRFWGRCLVRGQIGAMSPKDSNIPQVPNARRRRPQPSQQGVAHLCPFPCIVLLPSPDLSEIRGIGSDCMKQGSFGYRVEAAHIVQTHHLCSAKCKKRSSELSERNHPNKISSARKPLHFPSEFLQTGRTLRPAAGELLPTR